MVNKILASFVLVLTLTVSDPVVQAENLSTTQEKEAIEIIGSVMSPFCPGRLLSDCPSGDAAALRDQIKAKVLAGQSKDEITAFMVNLYGNGILAAPRFEGIGRLAWLAPIAFVLAGLFLVVAWLRSNFNVEEVDDQA